MTRQTIAQHYIDGSWLGADSGDIAESNNPATAETLGSYVLGSVDAAEAAIDAARRAFETTEWSQSPRLRAAVLFSYADNLQKRYREIVDSLTHENGKTLSEAEHETTAAISEARYYGGLARNIFGRMTELTPNAFSLLAKEPVGVAGIIVPWNAPVTLLVRSLAPALAAGCTAVIKSAPQTPLTNRIMIECLATIDALPAGVINSVNENGNLVGETMVNSKEVDVIPFTGSSRTGKIIMRNSADTLKRLSLELGGKAPAIVFEDADLDKSLAPITWASLVLAGQMCVAVERVLVHESRVEETRDRLIQSLSAVKVGPGYDPASQMGSMIDLPNVERVEKIIAQAKREGEILLEGGRISGAHENGAFLTPTIFFIDDVNSSLVQDELFGPIISLETFSSEAEAIEKANATRYGLAASVHTTNLDRAMRISRALKFGTVWLNAHTRLFAEIETGGYRESGMGRLHGVEGLDDFLETKHIFLESGQIEGL